MKKDENYLDSIPDDMDDSFDDSFDDDLDGTSVDKIPDESFDDYHDLGDEDFDGSDNYDDWENGDIDSDFAEAESNEFMADTIELDEDGNYVELLPHLLDIIPFDDGEKRLNTRVDLFHQSVVETIIETWQNCSQMCCDLLPDFPYVGLYFDTTQVGGFSFKDRRNEAKGSVIECINAGKITTLITEGLLKHKAFVFLPNASTLSAMDDFELLTDAKYTICFCDDEGNVYLSDLSVSYSAIAQMILSDVNIREIIIYELTDGASSEVDDFGDSEEIEE